MADDVVEYWNHFTGEKRAVKRAKLSGAVGKHNIDLSKEQDPDTKPLLADTYKDLSNANEAKGAMLFLNEPFTYEKLFERGNTIDEVIEFYADVIRACKKFNVELTPSFQRIKEEITRHGKLG